MGNVFDPINSINAEDQWNNAYLTSYVCRKLKIIFVFYEAYVTNNKFYFILFKDFIPGRFSLTILLCYKNIGTNSIKNKYKIRKENMKIH